MAYNGLGDRLEMTAYAEGQSVTTRYVLDNGQVLAAIAGGSSTFYLYGNGPLAELTGAWAYPLADGSRTARQLVDASGNVLLSSSYTPWGDTLSVSGSGSFMTGYLGGIMDSATGLLYVGNGQYYDPSTGRFLNRNARPNQPNPYVPWSGDPLGALMAPLAVMTIVYSRKKKRGKWDSLVIVVVLFMTAGMALSACDDSTPPPTITVSTPTPTPTVAFTVTVTATFPSSTSTPTQAPTITCVVEVTPSPTDKPSPTPAPYSTSITKNQSKYLTMMIVFESSSGNVPSLVNYMKAWALLNKLSFDIKYGKKWARDSYRSANESWVGEAWGQHESALLDQLGFTPDYKIRFIEVLGRYDRKEYGTVPPDKFDDINLNVDKAVASWQIYGSQSSADPVHGAVGFTDMGGMLDNSNVQLKDRPDWNTIYSNWKEAEKWRKSYLTAHPGYPYITDVYDMDPRPYTLNLSFTVFHGPTVFG